MQHSSHHRFFAFMHGQCGRLLHNFAAGFVRVRERKRATAIHNLPSPGGLLHMTYSIVCVIRSNRNLGNIKPMHVYSETSLSIANGTYYQESVDWIASTVQETIFYSSSGVVDLMSYHTVFNDCSENNGNVNCCS